MARSVYSHNWGLFWLAAILPFFVGALVARGSFALKLDLFLPLTGLLLAGIGLANCLSKVDAVWEREAGWLGYQKAFARVSGLKTLPKRKMTVFSFSLGFFFILLGAFVFLALHQGASWDWIGLYFFVWVCAVITVLEPRSPLMVIVASICLVVFTSLLAAIGVYSQFPNERHWQIGLLGLLPGSIGAAGMLVFYDTVFSRAGWRRKVVRVTRKGKEVARPCAHTLLLAFYGLFVPATVLWGAALQHLPTFFGAAAVVVFYTIPATTRFFEEGASEIDLWPGFKLTFFLTSLGMLVIGAASRG